MSSAASDRQSRLSVRVTRDGSSASVIITGDLDAHTAPELDGILGGVIALEDGPVIVDLSAIDFVGSAGAHSLLDARRELFGRGRRLELFGVPTTVARLLDIVGWDAAEPAA